MATSYAAVRAAINLRATGPCPMCAQDVWVGGDQLTELGDPPIAAIPFVCTSCGYIRLHALQALETIDD